MELISLPSAGMVITLQAEQTGSPVNADTCRRGV